MPIPSWVIDLAVKIALQLGVPFLFEKFPQIAAWIQKYVPDFEKIIKDIIEGLKGSGELKRQGKREAKIAKKATVRMAQRRMKECLGVKCDKAAV